MSTELDALSVAFVDAHPDEAARELEAMPAAQTAALLAALPARLLAPTFAALQPRHAAAGLAALDADRAALMLHALRTHDVTAALRHLPPAQRDALLERLPHAQALACRALLRYPEDAVGARAHTEVVALDASTDAAQALDALRRAATAGDGVFVVEGGRLRGWAGAARLLQAAPAATLGALWQPVAMLPALMPVAAAAELPALAREARAAVVERGGRLLGVVTLAELRDAAAAVAQRPADAADGLAGFVAAGYWAAVAALIDALLGAWLAGGAPRGGVRAARRGHR